jgi:NAD(P)-dependent dehydrogenase (short-subunit alcohol dehydrogenase family)
MNHIASLFDLTGRVAVVTGGAGLLGIQHALALAEVGASVVVTDIRQEAAVMVADRVSVEFASPVLALKLDVTDRASIQDAYQQILAHFGRIDILINNAAIDPKVDDDGSALEASRFEYFPLEVWDFQIAVGLTGAYLCAQLFGNHMATYGGGVILNIASDLSVIAPDQRLYRKEGLAEDRQPVKPVTYSVIKTGLIGLTRYLATYWAVNGVRVNALSPGGIYNGQPDGFVRRLVDLVPAGRMANVDEYRGAIQFMCSDASKYLTGQNIVMDGGRSCW